MRLEADDIYILDTGRKLFANCSILGLSPGGRVTEGYDSQLEPFGYHKNQWTVIERQEIANFMISIWTEWRDRDVS